MAGEPKDLLQDLQYFLSTSICLSDPIGDLIGKNLIEQLL